MSEILVHTSSPAIDPHRIQPAIMRIIAANRGPTPQAQIADAITQKFAVPYIEQLERLIDQGAVRNPPDNLVAFVLTPEGREWCHGQGIRVAGFSPVQAEPETQEEEPQDASSPPPAPRKRGRPRKDANAPAPDA